VPTDRALRPSCSPYIRARGAGPPEAIGEGKLGAAPEVDRHTQQLSEPPLSHGRSMAAISLRVTNSHGHKPPSRQPKLLW